MITKILWFTDLHLRNRADPLAGMIESRFQHCLDHALARHADADFCVFTGDIANDGQAAEYAAFTRLMSGFPLPYHALMGNHDARTALSVALASPGPSATGTLTGSRIVGDQLAIFLDTHIPGSDAGHLAEADLAWLDQSLAAADRPALIFMHHQPGRVFIPSFDGIGLENAQAFQALLSRHRDRIAHIFFGHCHLPISGSLAGIGITGLPATATQQAANFATDDFVADLDAEPCYGVILVDGPNLACHTLQVTAP